MQRIQNSSGLSYFGRGLKLSTSNSIEEIFFDEAVFSALYA